MFKQILPTGIKEYMKAKGENMHVNVGPQGLKGKGSI